MRKKLIVLALAVAAFAAMAVPASASAALTLKDSAGKILPGEWLVGTSTNSKLTNIAVGNLFCPHIQVAAELKTNNGSLITASNGAVGSLANCEAGGGSTLTVTSPTLTHLESSGSDAGNATLSFIADTGAFVCPFGGTVTFSYETGSTHNTLNVFGSLISSFTFCEEEEGEGEPPLFEGTYSMSTTDGSPVWIEPGA